MLDVGRREVISLIGSAVAAWPFTARAQQSERMPRVGALMPFAENDPEISPWVAALRQGLAQLGWTEGRTGSHLLREQSHRCASASSDLSTAFFVGQSRPIFRCRPPCL
jgi:hypothetical protein